MEDVESLCVKAKVELDIWERSRLADFLDNNVDGQWLRQELLGIQAERLSPELLLNLSKKSLNEFSNTIPYSSNLIDRKDVEKVTNRALDTGLTLLSAPSGYGKTAVALKIMNIWIQKNLPALWIPETVLEQESSLTSAIHRLVQELHGSHIVGSAVQAIGSIPFLLVVDDIARINQPFRAPEKVMAWTFGQIRSKPDHDSAIHLLVPSWSEFISGTRQDFEKELGPHIVELETLDNHEAV